MSAFTPYWTSDLHNVEGTSDNENEPEPPKQESVVPIIPVVHYSEPEESNKDGSYHLSSKSEKSQLSQKS